MIVLTHLWQSTVFAGVVAVLAMALRRAPAASRHAIWLTASVKLLLPFSALVAVGSYLGRSILTMTTPEATAAIRWIDRSLAVWTLGVDARLLGRTDVPRQALIAVGLVWFVGLAIVSVWRVRQWRTIGALTAAAEPLRHGREIDALRRVAPVVASRISLLQGDSRVEPAIVGFFRHRLLWPLGLSDRLTDVELESILAHEVSHVVRRDNAWSVVQVTVETLFWFHPIVWWIGARIVTECERACDEAVMQTCTARREYAEGLLKVCGFCLGSPSPCAAGVGGSDLVQRVERIMTAPTPKTRPWLSRLMFGSVCLLIGIVPVAAGVVYPHASAAQGDQKVYRAGDGITLPKVVHSVNPKYTKAALDAKIQGMVRLEAVVRQDGAVGDVTVTQSLDKEYGLDDQAVQALKEWTFEPGTKDGKPVTVRVEVEMQFTLK